LSFGFENFPNQERQLIKIRFGHPMLVIPDDEPVRWIVISKMHLNNALQRAVWLIFWPLIDVYVGNRRVRRIPVDRIRAEVFVPFWVLNRRLGPDTCDLDIANERAIATINGEVRSLRVRWVVESPNELRGIVLVESRGE